MVSMSPATACCHHTPSGWADLPPDLLGDVSDRLHDDAAEFVRLHAVCTSWRDALVSVTVTTSITVSCPPFRPHLITPCEGRLLRTAISFGRVSAGTTKCTSSYREGCDDIRFGDGGGCASWVASADGTAAWTFTNARLLNLLTGGVTQLMPSFLEYDLHRRMSNSHGIAYGDNTVFLYNIAYRLDGHPTLKAAILHPGDTTWTCVKFTSLDDSFVTGPLATAYHKGRIILLCVGVHYWCALTSSPHNGGGGDLELEPRWEKFDYVNHMQNYSYVLTLGDELLWVSVVVHRDSWWPDEDNIGDHIAHALSLTVHMLEEEHVDDHDGNVKMRWAPKDGRIILGDHVLFLGFPASFAVDARQLDMHGACAYFVIRRCVFEYDFMEGKARLMKRLCPIWHNGMTCSWLWPQPTIAPMQEIRKRLEAPIQTGRSKTKFKLDAY